MNTAIATPQENRLHRIPAVAERLSCSRTHAYELIYSGHLRSVRLPGTGSRKTIRIRESDLQEFIDSNLVDVGK